MRAPGACRGFRRPRSACRLASRIGARIEHQARYCTLRASKGTRASRTAPATIPIASSIRIGTSLGCACSIPDASLPLLRVLAGLTSARGWDAVRRCPGIRKALRIDRRASIVLETDGRGGAIRTLDLLNPIQVRYQAAPRPEIDESTIRRRTDPGRRWGRDGDHSARGSRAATLPPGRAAQRS